MKYKTLIIDPPWPYSKTSSNKKLRGYADKEYATLSEEDLKELPIDKLMDEQEAYVLLWTTGPFLPTAIQCIESWNFQYITSIVWVKAHKFSTLDGEYFRRSGYGVGYWFRGDHETVLIAKRKGAPSIKTNERSVILAPRQRHSKKPDDLHEIAMKYYPGPYLEIFGRKRYSPEWTTLGNEAPDTENEDIKITLQRVIHEHMQ